MKPIRNYRGEVGINLTYLHTMRNYSNTFSSKSQAFEKIFLFSQKKGNHSSLI